MSLEAYDRIKVIGKGSYGEVWLAKNKNDKKQYVLKKMDLRKASKRERLLAEQEAKLLSSLKHPNIVAYKDTFEGGDGFLYIAMGFCERGDLYSRLKEQSGVPLEERQVVEWFVQIAMALQYMHERNILHRDLKTQNIFLTKNKIIKVGDLGIARVLDSSSDMATTIIGTPYYMSPELFSNKPYNFKSDVWALGCCVYEMTTLKHAFNARDMNSLMYRILQGRMPPMPSTYCKELVDLIKAMLNKNHEKRPSVNRILRDPFIKQNIAIFLEGTKNSGSSSKRPNSAKRERQKDGEIRQRKTKPVAHSLEPLNVGADVLEPIKEEPTPRESIDFPSNRKSYDKSLDKQGDEQKYPGKDFDNFPATPTPSKVTEDEEAKQKVKDDEKRSKKDSKSSKKIDVPDTGFARHSEEKAPENDAGIVFKKVNRDKMVSHDHSGVVHDIKSSACSRPIGAEVVSNAVADNNASPVVVSRPLTSFDARNHRRSVSDAAEFRSKQSSSDMRRPRSSAELVSNQSHSSSDAVESKSSPSVSRSSASKSRSFPSSPKEKDALDDFSKKHCDVLKDFKQQTPKSRPLPPQPTNSAINPEPSRAIYKDSAASVLSSKAAHPSGDSGRSSSLSGSDKSGNGAKDETNEISFQNERRTSSNEVPAPLRSLDSSARQRRRVQQQQQQTHRNVSQSVDVSSNHSELYLTSHHHHRHHHRNRNERILEIGSNSERDNERQSSKSVDFENPGRYEARAAIQSSAWEAGSRHERMEPSPVAAAAAAARGESRATSVENDERKSSSSEEQEDDENESTNKVAEREERRNEKELNSFINLLGTTLRMAKKSVDSEDETDSGVEAIVEVPNASSSSDKALSAGGATFLVPAPSPLPSGAKYPYIDESSGPKSERNAKRRQSEEPTVSAPIAEEEENPLECGISMTSTGRLFERISMLRKDCIRGLGVAKLKVAYDILDRFDSDELEPKLIELLGMEDFDVYAGKIFQLKFYEESAFFSSSS